MNKLMWERKQKPRGSHCLCSFYLQAEERVQHFILRASLFSPVFTPGPWGHQTTPNIAQKSFINKSSGQKDAFKASVVTERPPQCCMGGVSGLTGDLPERSSERGMWQPHRELVRQKRDQVPLSLRWCWGILLSSEWAVNILEGCFMLPSNFKNVFTF